jgi:hypothetical protein
MPCPAEIYLNRFLNRPNVYAKQWWNGKGYTATYEPFNLDILYKHLCGEITVGTYLISESNTCKFMVFDIDEDQEDGVALLCCWLSDNGIYFFREAKREGRSGHVWVFVQTPIPSLDAFKIVGSGRSNFGITGEIYPPHEKLRDPVKQPGSQVRLPLGFHRKADITGLFLKCPSRDILDQLMWFIEQPINTAEEVLALSQTIPDPIKPKKKRHPNSQNTESLLAKLPENWTIEQSMGGEWLGQCPNCKINGWDRSESNLSISPDGKLLYCFRGCDFKSIMVALRKIKSAVIMV